MNGIIWLIVILVLATVIVMWGPEPVRTKAAEVGGVAFLLWILVKLFVFLTGNTGSMP